MVSLINCGFFLSQIFLVLKLKGRRNVAALQKAQYALENFPVVFLLRGWSIVIRLMEGRIYKRLNYPIDGIFIYLPYLNFIV